MKKNFLIMLLTVFCAGFAFAQDDNTVRGFVPAGGTGAGNQHETYAAFGQTFGAIFGATPYEVAEGLGQAQLIGDTLEAVIGCGDSIKFGSMTIYADSLFQPGDTPRDTFLTYQEPNTAVYNYDSLYVLHLFVCPCTTTDCDGNEYEVFALNNLCWTKPSMRTQNVCQGPDTNCVPVDFALEYMDYSSDLEPTVDTTVFGLLYTWENAIAGQSLTDSDYVQGICPCGWHIPTAAEIDTILNSLTNDLRSDNGHWVLPEGITNSTKFTAEPVGYYSYAKQRFDGHHSEVDFWFVSADSTADYFQILYYCDSVKQEARDVNNDAMSVRCVKDMIYEYHKNDTTPTPNPNPNPNPTPNPDPNPGPECEFQVGDVEISFADQNAKVTVTNYSTDYFEYIHPYFKFFKEGQQVGEYDYSQLDLNIENNEVTTAFPAGLASGSYDSVYFMIMFGLDATGDYFHCAEDDNIILRELGVPVNTPVPVIEVCPEFNDNAFDVHIEGTRLYVSGQIKNYSSSAVSGIQGSLESTYSVNGTPVQSETSFIINPDNNGNFSKEFDLPNEHIQIILSLAIDYTSDYSDCSSQQDDLHIRISTLAD